METNKKINCSEVPKTLTTEFWIECLHSPHPQISEAALIKLIRENLEKSQPRLTFSEAGINWGIPGTAYLNIEQTPRELCQLIYGIACEINRPKALENCIKLLDEGLACHYCYENYLDICDLLCNLDYRNPLRRNCLEVINRHYSACYFKYLQRLIVFSVDAPEIGGIILRLLKEAQPDQTAPEGLQLNGINNLQAPDTETLYRIYMELCRLGSLETLAAIAQCYNRLPKSRHRRLAQQIYRCYRKRTAETKRTYSANISAQIAKNLPLRQGCRIYRNLLSRGENGYLGDYIRYCCQNPLYYFPNREFIFLDQKIIPQSGSWVLPELCTILKENQDAENFCSQILTWLEKWKTFAPELESEDVFSIIQELKNAIMLWKQSAPNKNRSSLMTRCHCLIEYFYANTPASPEIGKKRPTATKTDDPSSYIAAVLELLSRD